MIYFYFTMETKSTKNGHQQEGVHRPVHQQEGGHEQGGGWKKMISKGKIVIRGHFALRSREKCTFTEITMFLPSDSEPKYLLNKMHLPSESECTDAI